MRRLLHPFVLVVSAILVVGYVYTATRLTSTAPVRAALAAPFLMVWILPVVYWFGDRDHWGRVHEWVQALSFLCMGWLSFLLVHKGSHLPMWNRLKPVLISVALTVCPFFATPNRNFYSPK